MKLVEILARELSEWPEGVKSITQSVFDGDLYNDRRIMDRKWGFRATERHTESSAYPVVTREMWEAERARVSHDDLLDAASYDHQTKRLLDDPRHSRDRIRAIDAQLAELTLERAERVAELAAEGFALLPVVDVVEPAGDMEDWRNWQAGDLIEVSGDDCARDGVFKLRSFDFDTETTMHVYLDQCGWPEITSMKFHSRPKPC
jgi:hypothetical protein